jgi:N-acetylglutamate synthase-like GNAT family acetyltransferase
MSGILDYAVSAAVSPDELSGLLQDAAGSRYSPRELQRLIDGSTAYVTARDAQSGGRLVGFGRVLSDGAVVAYINNMAVSPDYQRRGVGQAILRLLVEAAGEVKSIFLYSNTADAFYLRHGFERSEKRLYLRRRSPAHEPMA